MDTVVVNHIRTETRHRQDRVDVSRSRMRRVLRGMKREVEKSEETPATTKKPPQIAEHLYSRTH